MKIVSIKGREVLDSRGSPTVEAQLLLDNGQSILASAPSGKSTGSHEALELRDGDNRRYEGQGVLKAVENINTVINDAIKGLDPTQQSEIDKKLIELDGTDNKSKLGANATIATSIAAAKAGAVASSLPLYSYLAQLAGYKYGLKMPVAMFNVINGGAHADNNLSIQEFMIVPSHAQSFRERLRAAAEHFERIRKILQNNGFSATYGDEGGFAPSLPSDQYAIDIILEAGDINIALDCASHLPPKMTVSDLVNNKNIMSLEDPLGEDDWDGWQKITHDFGARVMLVGDDLFVTNIERLKKGAKQKAANAIIIKPNQIGTLTETLEFIKYAQANNYKIVVSHRSGETEDTFIADLAVGVGANFIKSGAPSRGERIAKYNRLLRIEEMLFNNQ